MLVLSTLPPAAPQSSTQSGKSSAAGGGRGVGVGGSVPLWEANILEKVALSHGMQRSVKIDRIEYFMDALVQVMNSSEQCVAVRCVCCYVLQCAAVCCSVLQYVATCCSVL